MNIRQQSEAFLESLQSRRRNPIKPRTLKAYQSYLRTWIVPLVGGEDLAKFENGSMKKFVSELTQAGLGPATTVSIVNCLKGVIGSALDENGNEIYPRKWNNEFVDLPVVNQRDQKTPIVTPQEVTGAIKSASRQFAPLYALLAASGLRIAEAMALEGGPDDGKGTFWIREQRTIVVRGQLQSGRFLSPKTAAGYRTVDLCGPANDILRNVGRPAGKLFSTPISTLYEAASRDGVPGFHAFRRFRVTRLRETSVPEDITKYWIGHGSSGSTTDRYSKLAQNEVLRKEWAERAGLGFSVD